MMPTYSMQYPAYTVEDFCKDANFIRWVITPTSESNRFWQDFMDDYPHKTPDIQIAIGYVKTIHFRETDVSEQDLTRLKQQIWKDIDTPARLLAWYQRPYWAVAAVIVLVASVSVGWWAYRANAALTYQTAYGKIQTIRLADGSVVTLNANSSLKVADNLINGSIREVWLDGEAYFAIAKRKGAKFIVHTPEAKVEVLGTEFNVNTRREQTNVVLEKGKVQLSTDNATSVVMQPGDMATVTPKSRKIQLKIVQPDHYDAWKNSYIVLDGKSVPEIIDILEDNFGVTIQLENSKLAHKKLTGKLRTQVTDDCIENLAIIIEAKVKKSGDTYWFRGGE